MVGQATERHRSREFIAFLDHVPSHKSAGVAEWLGDNPDWTFHFTPTSASQANSVEDLFSRLSWQRFKDAVFNSMDECVRVNRGLHWIPQ
ncbi:MAG: transposase [Rhodobacteraceae bacterium]|nr:transposase [Paracoccaceae bacterium]